MSRLIDADELLNMSFSNGINENGILYVPFREVMSNIKNTPTAYDVEKVKAELKEKLPIYTQRAINIIKRGGKE